MDINQLIRNGQFGGPISVQEQHDAEQAKIAAGWAQFDAIWTRAEFDARRAKWNTEVRRQIAAGIKKIDQAKLEKMMGFTASDLAVAKNRLGVA